jgi:hypothetical protein
MPSYTLSSGESFQTILLPKGTVLFRGFDVHIDKPHPEYIFTDLFGSQAENGYYCTDPHENKFFYPAPFVSDSVNRYSIHAIYITNYDLELVTMLNPSKNSRQKQGTEQSAYLRCSSISDKDLCGRGRKSCDPCLSPLLLNEYPHIQGYIAIAETDAKIFQKGQIPSFLRDVPEVVQIITPFIVSDSRGLQSIPEIVLFPYHTRPASVFDTIQIHPHAPEPDMFAYALKHRAKLNYFPLVYVTETNIYSFMELLNKTTLNELANSERINTDFDSPLTTNMLTVIKRALSSGGLLLKPYSQMNIYKFTIDIRTGFWIANIPEVRKLNWTTQKIKIRDADYSENTQIVPFFYPREFKHRLHSALTKRPITEEELESNLNRVFSSYTKYHQFNRGSPNTFKTIYKMEMSTPRSDLKPPSKRFTRKHKKSS